MAAQRKLGKATDARLALLKNQVSLMMAILGKIWKNVPKKIIASMMVYG